MDDIPEDDKIFWPEIQVTPVEKRSERVAKVRHELQLLKQRVSASADLVPIVTDSEYMQSLRAANYDHANAFHIIESVSAQRDKNGWIVRRPVPSCVLEYAKKEKLFLPEIWSAPTEEFEETLRIMRTKLDWLKERVLESSDLDIPTDDAFLIRFLRACDNHAQEAFAFIRNYFKLRVEIPRVFKDFVPSKILESFSPTLMGLSVLPDPQGRLIVFNRGGTWDPSAQTSIDVVRNCTLGLECTSLNLYTQKFGVITIMDMKGSNWNQVRNFPLQDLKLLLRLIQEYTPVKITAIYIINEPYIIHLIYQMVKIFIKTELDEKIHFLGSNLDSLHRVVPPECLPSDYGGTLGPLSNEGLRESLLEREEDFATLLNYGFKCKT